MLHDASITNALVTIATHVVRSAGYAGIVAMAITSSVIAIPGIELTMLFAGFTVAQHHLSLLGVILAGLAGDLIGITIAFWIGWFGFHELLERWSPLHVGPSGLARVHRWFERWGDPAIVVSRDVPTVRSVFPYVAGIAKVRYLRFILLSAIGSAVWVTAMALVGQAVGHEWPVWRKHLAYVDYAAIALIIVLIVWFVVSRLRTVRASEQPTT